MRRTTFLLVLATTLLGCLIPVGLFAQKTGKDDTPTGAIVTSQQLQGVVNPLNPSHYKNQLAMPSGVVMSLLTLQKQGATHPAIQSLEKRFGLTPVSKGPMLLQRGVFSFSPAPAHDDHHGGGGCNNQTGAKFNLEPATGSPGLNLVMPQDETPVDFMPGGGVGGADLVIGGANDYRGVEEGLVGSTPGTWGFSVTGYYVHTNGDDNNCSVTFEGGLPSLMDSFGFRQFGGGDPVVAVDGTRGNVYFGDLRFSGEATAVGLFRQTAANIDNPAVCTSGTHLLDASGNETAQSTCWPTGILVAPEDQFASNAPFHDKPHIRVDERPNSVCTATNTGGCGDIYVSWTEFTFNPITFSSASQINLAVCKNTFTTSADCSAPLTISGADLSTQFSHIATRPDGAVSVTYIQGNGGFTTQSFNINYVSCTPNVLGAPNPPACAAPLLVTTEAQPHPFGYFLSNQRFRTTTYPTHDNRLNGGVVEEFVAWQRCKVPAGAPLGAFATLIICPDDDVRMAWAPTDSNGVPTSTWTVSDVNTSPGDQIFPWVKANHDSNRVEIAYISSENDSQFHTFQLEHNIVKKHKHTAGDSELLTQTAFDPSDDPLFLGGFIGDYIGVATKGNTSYFHFTGTNFQGLLGGISIYEDNNQLVKKSSEDHGGGDD